MNRSITITRLFSEPPEHLWKAWTDIGLAKMWFGSDPGGTVRSASFDVRKGGSFAVSFVNSDGTAYTCKGQYQDIDFNRRLVFSWFWADRPETVEHVVVELKEEGSGTRMIFQHQDIDAGTSHDYEAGWNRTFDKLDRALRKAFRE